MSLDCTILPIINQHYFKLIFCVACTYVQDEDKVVRVIVNVTYSYAIIVSAATAVQCMDELKNDEKVKNLKFSNKWVKSFLERGGLTRRKITREDRDVPDDDVVSSTLRIGQQIYERNRHSPRTCFNFDETAFTWAIGPSYMYCPGNQQRASNIGISNTKLRITAVIAVNAIGEFAPLMLIVKHSVSSEKRPDQSGMTVIKELFKKNRIHRKCWMETEDVAENLNN